MTLFNFGVQNAGVQRGMKGAPCKPKCPRIDSIGSFQAMRLPQSTFLSNSDQGKWIIYLDMSLFLYTGWIPPGASQSNTVQFSLLSSGEGWARTSETHFASSHFQTSFCYCLASTTGHLISQGKAWWCHPDQPAESGGTLTFKNHFGRC